MKTDVILYQLVKEFPSIFFELIGKPETNPNAYKFTAPGIKERSFRLDGVFSTLEEFTREPLYFVEVQFYKDEEFYERLFGGIFLYFRQEQPPNSDWYAIVIYDCAARTLRERRSHEVSPHPRYRALIEPHLRRIYLNELGETAAESIGIGMIKLVVETQRNASSRAVQLIDKAREELTDAIVQEQVVQFIETIVVYKFPTLSREAIEAMLGLSDLKKTKVYQEAFEEGLDQGLDQGKLLAKLETVPLLLELGLSIQEVAQRLGLDVETVREAVEGR